MSFTIGLGLGPIIHWLHVWSWWTEEDDIARLLSTLAGYYAEALVAIDALWVVGIDKHWDIVGLTKQSPGVDVCLLPFPFSWLTVLFGMKVVPCRYFPSSH